MKTSIENSWAKIAPFWPLKHFIAANPLAGFEHLPFEEALSQAQAYFQHTTLPEQMQNVNRESIKWLQAFLDEGQATISMPSRHKGLLNSTLALLQFDNNLITNAKKRAWLKQLPQTPEKRITHCLSHLSIPADNQEQFLTLMLTTLPGWAAHIVYRTKWTNTHHQHPVTPEEYLAFRLLLTCLLWPEAKELISWHNQEKKQANTNTTYAQIREREATYQTDLLQKLATQKASSNTYKPDAQLLFCIDVRSEPFRRALESQGAYETFGIAGFFGVPVTIKNAVTGKSHAACPVLLKPLHTVVENPTQSPQQCHDGYHRKQSFKKIYQSVKYTFTTPFSLVEALGVGSGLWMAIKNVSPTLSMNIKKKLQKCFIPTCNVTPDIDSIPFEQQVTFALDALNTIGFTRSFAPLVVLCGHGSTTENNAYATALDCGACGGNHGAPNARILAQVLNTQAVRGALKGHSIEIPATCYFVGAEHNTTTDEVEIYDHEAPQEVTSLIATLKKDLTAAQAKNSLWRAKKMNLKTTLDNAAHQIKTLAYDWAQTRPEWGLAQNASFIVGPRWLTKDTNLTGRAFLHSYDWELDKDGASLTTILTAPVVVAQWINAQYLFSTLDNATFGAGSKVTQNITGKIGIMQGNASDLMHGLPLQSVNQSDTESYHEPLRLTIVVYAPKAIINPIISQEPILQKLFGNGWIHLICIDPQTKQKLMLKRDFTWKDSA